VFVPNVDWLIPPLETIEADKIKFFLKADAQKNPMGGRKPKKVTQLL